MKKLISRLLGKFSLCAIMILLQFGWLTYVLYRATMLSHVFNSILHVIAVVLALHVVNKDLKPYYKLSWCFLFLCLPIFGCTSYFLFGRSELTKGKRQQLEKVLEDSGPWHCAKAAPPPSLEGEGLLLRKETGYIANYAHFPLYQEDGSMYFSCGEEAFPRMLEDLERAEHYIFLEYFIIAPGRMFDTILEILQRKVAEGVEVRLIYDDFGSINTVSPRFDKILEEKGIRCVRFNPFRPVLAVVMNNRDHRKILVVDGKVAYTGGINLADEYINEKERFGYWKDEAIRLEGDSAWSFVLMFLEMWSYITGSGEDYGRYLMDGEKVGEPEGDAHPPAAVPAGEGRPPEAGGDMRKPCGGLVQPFADSPLNQEAVSENVYMNLINGASRYVYIFTPYLILSWEMGRALVNAAKTGVDVRIVTPGVPDKRLVYLLTQANYEALIRGGVKIYTYSPGFIHSKCIVADDRYAVVGTINLDFRSLYLHFECGVFLYNVHAVQQVRDDAESTFPDCHPVTLAECENKNFFYQLFLSVLQLFAPML